MPRLVVAEGNYFGYTRRPAFTRLIYPAPVDGGRRRAQCRVDGDLVTWKPVDATNPEENRWMNQAGDPLTRFVLDGERVTINQTLPDGGVVADLQGQG